MRITLSHDIGLDIGDKHFNITYRDITDKERKRLEKKNQAALNVSNRVEKLARKEILLGQRLEAYREMGENEKVIETLDALEDIEKKAQALEDEFNKLGGTDLAYEIHKEEFYICVGGEDKEKLFDYILENSSFKYIMDAIKKNIVIS